MKYEKPIARDLSGISSATGQVHPLSCMSGADVSETCSSGFSNVGSCINGGTAGYDCNAGSTPNQSTTCSAGTNATECVNGSWAGV